MRSRTTRRFRGAFAELPQNTQRQARRAFAIFQADPNHPSLHFKRVHLTEPIYSARVGTGYRALGERGADEMTWFWIGSHADYEKQLV